MTKPQEIELVACADRQSKDPPVVAAEKADKVHPSVSDSTINKITETVVVTNNFALRKGNSKKMTDTSHAASVDTTEINKKQTEKKDSSFSSLPQKTQDKEVSESNKKPQPAAEQASAIPKSAFEDGKDMPKLSAKELQIDTSTIALAKKLKLQIIEGHTIAPGTLIQLNAAGLIGSKRNTKDGIAYFGTEAGTVRFALN